MPSDRSLLVAAAIALKGVVMAAIAAAVGTTFGQSIVLISVSGLITGTAVVLAAVITAKSTRQHTDELRDIKHKLGAANRASDP